MAFEGDQGVMANTLFPNYQRKASLNIGCGSNGCVPFISIPSFNLQEPNSGSCVPWSHNAHDDPYELINCPQNHLKNRKPSDVTDDGETELQGLVSNILDEADSQDSLCSNGLDQRSNNIWSPKILRDELLQYFQSEAKTQYNSNFAPNNYTSHDAFGKTQAHAVNKETEDICAPPSNGFNSNQQMHFNLTDGVQNSFSQPQKPPPGLTLPHNMANSFLQLQPNNYENMPVSKDRANGENIGNFLDLSQVFRPQNDMNCSDLLYEDHYSQAMHKPGSANEQYTSQDLSQLISSFQPFVTGEQDGNEFGNVHEDNMAERWSPKILMQANSSAQMQGQLGTDFGREKSNQTRKQLFEWDSLQDLSTYSLQSAAEYSPQQRLSMGNHNKVLERDNSTHSFAMNHYPKHHVQQSPLKFKPQMQREKKRMASYFGDTYATRAPTSEFLPEEKRPALSQNSFYDRPQRFDRENNTVSQTFMPLVSTGNDPRRRPSQIPNTNFSPTGSLLYRGGVANVDMAEMASTKEVSGLSGLNGVVSRRGENTYHGMSSTLSPTPINQGEPVLELYYYLDECYEQWRSLEKERKRTEILLSKTFLGKLTTALPNCSLPKTPPNLTRVDHLIFNQMREEARVSSLFDKIECLSSVSLHANVYITLSKFHTAICVTSALRKDEILNLSQSQREHFTDDRDTVLLITALKDLAVTTRNLCTALWIAQQTILPKSAQPRASGLYFM